MIPADLADMTLEEFCNLYSSGQLPHEFEDKSLKQIVLEAAQQRQQDQHEEQDQYQLDQEQSQLELEQVEVCDEIFTEKTMQWREKHPNSNLTNPPLLLWRGDENNDATVACALGVYEEEFSSIKNELIEVQVEAHDGTIIQEMCSVEIDHPKDEKLARKLNGLAGSGSDYLCTYCSCSRKNISKEEWVSEVTLTNRQLREAAHYCHLNPAKKKQDQISKISFGVKQVPIVYSDPAEEKPDSLHLDINVSKHLITVAARLFHHKVSGQPLVYTKAAGDKKQMESSEAMYYKILRQRIATLPELTQNPGNFAREYCDPSNAIFIREPLPNIPDSNTWNDCMELWRKLRTVHKSSTDPKPAEVQKYKTWVASFLQKITSLKWVPTANQIHRLIHLPFFMENGSITSIGAFSLEGSVESRPTSMLISRCSDHFWYNLNLSRFSPDFYIFKGNLFEGGWTVGGQWVGGGWTVGGGVETNFSVKLSLS